MRIILILISLSFSCLSYAYDQFFEPDYPFEPFVRQIPAPALERIRNSDILFVGETHIGSLLSQEKKYKRKGSKIGRRNSLNQENLYYNLIKKFSEIHALAKKCLWLEYADDDEPNLEKWLNGLHEGRSHYYLINEAKAQGWSIFAVDGYEDRGRDDYMAKNIANTIHNGQCEKGISVNGHLHLSCTEAFPHCREPNATGVFADKKLRIILKESLGLVNATGATFASLDKQLRIILKNMGLAKNIDILRIPDFDLTL